jgi:hypothetical protein
MEIYFLRAAKQSDEFMAPHSMTSLAIQGGLAKAKFRSI